MRRGHIPAMRGAWRANTRGRGRGMTSPRGPRLTHFIALPIGHHVELRTKISSFTSALTNCSPPIDGLHESIVIAPRRLHLTLGVMSLPSDRPAGGHRAGGSGSTSSPALSNALHLLHALKPRVMEILGGKKLCVPLDRMDVMKLEEQQWAHVMYVGPSTESDDYRRLKAVTDMIHKAFLDAGLVVDEGRPLKLHCTVLNTVYRQPRVQGRRQPFSYTSVLASPAFRAISRGNLAARGPQAVDLGTWTIDEVQICEMGSHGPEGEYVSCGAFSLS